MSVRLRRLAADFQNMQRAFGAHAHVRILEVEGDPPERYKLEYRLKGLVVQDGRVVAKASHIAEVYLPLGYPRQAPQCRMLTPVYHPNIAPHAICIGDHWSAGESLAALVARIGEFITFQSYNVKSPLNGEAARWAEQNVDKIPLQKVDLSVDVEGMAPASAAAPAGPAVRYPSALTPVDGEGPFPYDAWVGTVVKELRDDAAVGLLGPAIMSVVSYLKARRLEEAVRGFEPIRATPAAARFPQIHFLVALLREAQGDAERQIQSLENATRMDPTYALAWLSLGRVQLKTGRSADAAEAFERLRAIDPANDSARRALRERAPNSENGTQGPGNAP